MKNIRYKGGNPCVHTSSEKVDNSMFWLKNIIILVNRNPQTHKYFITARKNRRKEMFALVLNTVDSENLESSISDLLKTQVTNALAEQSIQNQQGNFVTSAFNFSAFVS